MNFYQVKGYTINSLKNIPSLFARPAKPYFPQIT